MLTDENKDQFLKMLDLGSNFIKDPGAKLISKMLLKNMVLEKLYLNNNEISNKGKN